MKIIKEIDHWFVIHATIILACVVGVIFSTLPSQDAQAGWFWRRGSTLFVNPFANNPFTSTNSFPTSIPNTAPVASPIYTPYSTGTHPITATTPGVEEHYAQDASGVAKSVGTLKYDPILPNLVSTPMTFSADASKAITISFNDIYSGVTLSGVALIEVKLLRPDNTTASYSVSNNDNLNLTHNFSKAGSYSLRYHVRDNAGNDSGWVTVNNFFKVVAGLPIWLASNCSGNNYYVACPSNIAHTSGNKIADGSEYHTISLNLADKYGNPVIPVAGVKNVRVNISFHNTDYLDQISGRGDAAHIVFSESSLDLMGSNSGTTMITNTGFISEPVASADGIYLIKVYSFAPTTEGYDLIGNSIHFGLDSMNYEIIPASGFSGVGEGNGSRNNSDFYLAFSPALTASPQAMNFTDGSYVAGSDAMQNITINAAKRFLISIPNASSRNSSNVELGLLISTDDPDVTWGNAILEKSHGVTVSQGLNIVTSQPMTSIWNNIPYPADNVLTGETKYIRIQSTPVLRSGGQTDSTFSTLFRTHIGYDINGRHPRYRTGRILAGSIPDDGDDPVDVNVQNTNIEVIGASHSDSSFGFISTLDSQPANSTLGDVFRSEFKSNITRNVASYLQDPNAVSKACKNTSYTITSSNWDNFPCKFSSGSILYFYGADVILEDSTLSALRLSGGAKTILIKGGNLKVRSNLAYGSKSDSLGVILLKDDNHNDNPLDDGGNLFIDPDVTNISLLLYAEGSVISVNKADVYEDYSGTDCPSDGTSGFCDRSRELRNQLYWQGSLVSQNTIGGSDADSPFCPTQVSNSACVSRYFAQVFDLNYIRTFHALSGGQRAGGLNSLGIDTDLLLPNPPDGVANNHAFIIKYDSRIKSNTPPLFVDASSTGGSQFAY